MIVANPSINPAAVQASRAAAAQQAHNMQNGIVQQQMPQEPQVGPSVTVFVGNISEKGTRRKWQVTGIWLLRVQGAGQCVTRLAPPPGLSSGRQGAVGQCR